MPGELPPGRIGLFKTPDCTDPVIVVLIVVVLVSIVEILFPRVVVIVLRRTPIVVVRESADTARVTPFWTNTEYSVPTRLCCYT